MKHVEGIGRSTELTFCLEDRISTDNPVRVIDALVDSIDLASLDFEHVEVGQTGRPPYDPRMLLKLYFYGYYNGIRSSRKLVFFPKCATT